MCLAIIFVVLEGGLFETTLLPWLQENIGGGNGKDAFFLIGIAYAAIVGSTAWPLSRLLVRLTWERPH